MGCFNDTCFLTNLPISHRDEVVAFFLVPNPYYEAANRCAYIHTTAQFTVLPIVLTGRYNDEGGMDHPKTAISEFLLEELQKVLDPKAFPAGRVSFEAMFEAEHNENLFIESRHAGSLPLRHIFIRKQVLASLISTFEVTYIRFDADGARSRITQTFQQVVKEIPEFFSQYQRFKTELPEPLTATSTLQSASKVWGWVNDQLTARFGSLGILGPGKNSASVTHCELSARNLFYTSLNLEEEISRGVLTDWLLVEWLNLFLEETYRTWTPPLFGSQIADTEACRFLASLVIRECAAIKRYQSGR